MDHPAPLLVPILDKLRLFMHLPTDPQNPNRRFLQCPATGHVYCMSTGSLYWKMPSNISSLNQRNNSSLLPSSPALCTSNTFPLNTKNTDKLVQDNDASTTLSIENNRNKACMAKSEAFTQANSPVQGANSSMCLQSNSVPITKKKVRKRSRKTKDQSVPLLENPGAISKKPASRKKNKSTVLPQPNSTSSFINNPSSSYKKPASIAQTTSRSKAIIHADDHLSKKNKRQSYTYYTFYLTDIIKVIQPMQIHFEHLLFPQNVSPQINLPKFSRKHAEENTENIEECSLSNSKDKCSPKCREKTSLCFSREDYLMIYFENNFKKKTAKKKTYGPVSDGFKNIWECLQPFNRRPHSHHKRPKSLMNSQYKNCIMASSVHEIVHSRFAKNTNEHMPESQVRAMLSSGDRKLRTQSEWIKHMEEEAVHKYKKLNLEKHKQRLEVQEYNVFHHKEKFWLACSSRSVIRRKNEKSWPLLVKCLHKYPDSTLRQASKHRSFCLRWNGTSYTLRMDHAYYTQIQCLMAITDTSYAELVVHTRKETTILLVCFDFDFWKQTEATLETFFTSNILPYLKKNEIESNPISDPLDSNTCNDLTEE
ncbi:uncharacterized protein LOC142760943 [Rhinoderma darwinii]|uniref:uncharacterized protein LOC142760943 n=1 Tax=Rhinoderma darwinii TaxID=43563 RepID=UPI003F66920F